MFVLPCFASPWPGTLFWTHYALAQLFRNERKFDDAHVHIERAKVHNVNNAYRLARAIEFQATVWYEQHELEEAKSEALHVLEIYEKLGAAGGVENCRDLLQKIERAMETRSTRF